MDNVFELDKESNTLILTQKLKLNEYHKKVILEIESNHRELGWDRIIEFRETRRSVEQNKMSTASYQLESIGLLKSSNESWHRTYFVQSDKYPLFEEILESIKK